MRTKLYSYKSYNFGICTFSAKMKYMESYDYKIYIIGKCSLNNYWILFVFFMQIFNVLFSNNSCVVFNSSSNCDLILMFNCRYNIFFINSFFVKKFSESQYENNNAQER